MGILSSKPKRAVREPKGGWDSRLWASRVPFAHPENFVEVFRAGWENRDQLSYAWRILRDGVCDGCALGTSGLADWTIDGVHLCNIRLRLLRLNTMPALDPQVLTDPERLKAMRARDLRDLGRIPFPMLRRRGEQGFSRIDWEQAFEIMAGCLRSSPPKRTYFYLTSRGIPNETYYVAQKAVRAMGSNNLDNAARICHSPSTFALKASLGVAATTCSYSDLIGTDLISFIGSNVANNQPVMMKYLFHAKKADTKIATVNPYLEPGMAEYWVPSDMESALFGTKITDEFFQVRAGGDMAFLLGTIKSLIARGAVDEEFVSRHTTGFEELRSQAERTDWQLLERESGLSRQDMERYGDMIEAAERAIFVWGMGVTQHTCGEESVHAIVNLALLKGFVGREGCGLMPIRGHSGVQGGAEMGAYASAFPGGIPIDAESAATLSDLYGFEVPSEPGMTLPEALDAAGNGELDVLFAVGGNFREVMPSPGRVDEALARIGLRVHMDVALSSQMLVDPGEGVLLLPATTRYEIPGGVTETSTERRVIYSPEIFGPRLSEARPEWEVLSELAALVRPDRARQVRFESTSAIRVEIAKAVPFYSGIERLTAKGDQFQYGGPHLCADWRFATEDGKAHFRAAPLQTSAFGDGTFTVVTRRGKQFNSMVHADNDPLSKMPRDAVLICREDARRLDLEEGQRVKVANEHGTFIGPVRFAPVASGTVHLHWPEANVLVDPQARSPLAKIPAYKAARAEVAPAVEGEAAPLMRV